MSESAPRATKAVKATATAEEQDTPVEPVGPPEPVEVPVTRLIDEAPSFLGYPTHTAMGALRDDIGQTMTADQAKAKVADWLKQPVTVEEG